MTDDMMRGDYRQLSDLDKARMKEIKQIGREFWDYLDELPSSRELALAKTKIEEAVMWAVKGITG